MAPGMREAGGTGLPAGWPEKRRLMSSEPLGSRGVWQSSQAPSSTNCAPRAAEVGAGDAAAWAGGSAAAALAEGEELRWQPAPATISTAAAPRTTMRNLGIATRLLNGGLRLSCKLYNMTIEEMLRSGRVQTADNGLMYAIIP